MPCQWSSWHVPLFINFKFVQYLINLGYGSQVWSPYTLLNTIDLCSSPLLLYAVSSKEQAPFWLDFRFLYQKGKYELYLYYISSKNWELETCWGQRQLYVEGGRPESCGILDTLQCPLKGEFTNFDNVILNDAPQWYPYMGAIIYDLKIKIIFY